MLNRRRTPQLMIAAAVVCTLAGAMCPACSGKVDASEAAPRALPSGIPSSAHRAKGPGAAGLNLVHGRKDLTPGNSDGTTPIPEDDPPDSGRPQPDSLTL